MINTPTVRVSSAGSGEARIGRSGGISSIAPIAVWLATTTVQAFAAAGQLAAIFSTPFSCPMKSPSNRLSLRRAVLLVAGLACAIELVAAPAVAPKPLYRDPVYDGAADPVVIWNPAAGRWWMFYTNRRANAPGLSGVAWVHGTPIGIAESADGGITWKYLGDADIRLPAELAHNPSTYWAPDVIVAPDGMYHMFLTLVPGVFEDWNYPRTLVHLTSRDLLTWDHAQPLTLASDRVIDAVVRRLPDGTWRMWYNNERDHKAIYYADSPDLATWTDKGKCPGTSERPGEGPYVFEFQGKNWMLVDVWKGIGVYHSDDLVHWTVQAHDLLKEPGHGADDDSNGQHVGVVVDHGRAWCFYFVHPRKPGGAVDAKGKPLVERRSSIQVVELFVRDGELVCDRDAPTAIQLTQALPPKP